MTGEREGAKCLHVTVLGVEKECGEFIWRDDTIERHQKVLRKQVRQRVEKIWFLFMAITLTLRFPAPTLARPHLKYCLLIDTYYWRGQSIKGLIIYIILAPFEGIRKAHPGQRRSSENMVHVLWKRKYTCCVKSQWFDVILTGRALCKMFITCYVVGRVLGTGNAVR